MHAVAGYEWPVGDHLHLKLETYYQFLYDVPVEVEALLSRLPTRAVALPVSFPALWRTPGTGDNKGIELHSGKTFCRHYFYLLTGSLYDSRYGAAMRLKDPPTSMESMQPTSWREEEFRISQKHVLSASTKSNLGRRKAHLTS